MAGRRATDKEIADLLEAIWHAFKGVGRGISWSQARVIDSYGSREEENAARDKDRDTNWKQMADDPHWNMRSGVGGWNFLDALGFRYYLAAAMTKCLRERIQYDDFFEFQFELDSDYIKEKWAEFTADQMWVAAEFVLTMSRLTDDPWSRGEWRKTYERFWQRLHARKTSGKRGRKSR